MKPCASAATQAGLHESFLHAITTCSPLLEMQLSLHVRLFAECPWVRRGHGLAEYKQYAELLIPRCHVLVTSEHALRIHGPEQAYMAADSQRLAPMWVCSLLIRALPENV